MERIYLQEFLAAVCAASSTTRNSAPGAAQVPSFTCVRAEGGSKCFRAATPLGLYTETAEWVV